MTFVYVVVSEYAGEQGHLAGGDYREHARFPDPAKAQEWIDKARATGQLNYRDVRIEVRQR